MAHIFRPVYTRTVPPGTEVIEHKKWGRCAKIKRGLEVVLAPICENDPTRCRVEAAHWYVELRLPGGGRKRVKGFRDRRSTEELAHRLTQDAERAAAGLAPAHGPARLLVDCHRAYAEELAREGKSAEHLRQVRRAVPKAWQACGWRTLADVRPDGMRAFLTRLREQGRSARTQNAYLGLTASFVNWCVRQGWLAANPLAVVRPARDDRDSRPQRRRALTPDELRRLLDAAPPRRRAVYALAAYTGFRRGTLARLERQHFDAAAGRWRLPGGLLKGRRAAALPATPDAAALVAELSAAGLRPEDRLLPRPPQNRTFTRDCERAGLAVVDASGRRLVFHSLRYTFAVAMARALPIQRVKVLMCHRTLTLTADLYGALGLDDVADDDWQLPPVLP